jgi:SAM-dependent methyltransferase
MVDCLGEVQEHFISHTDTHAVDVSSIKMRLQETELLALPLEEKLSLLEQLTQFDLGRFLLEQGGLNGYWTSYLIFNAPQANITPLEEWILNNCPAVLATRERYHIFQGQLQHYVQPNITMASIPCGLMDDLLSLDYNDAKNVKLVGIDLDRESITLAEVNARTYRDTSETSFIKRDAWQLDMHETFNVITSNGLNIYEPDNAKVIALYSGFYQALKPQGILVTSFLTPPPVLSPQSSWQNFDDEAVKKQRAIFADILRVRWQSFRTEAETRTQLETAGFKILDIIYDRQGMFPTMVAQKDA